MHGSAARFSAETLFLRHVFIFSVLLLEKRSYNESIYGTCYITVLNLTFNMDGVVGMSICRVKYDPRRVSGEK